MNSGRKLQWIFSEGQAVVKAIFPSRTYGIQLATIQAVMLLAFNPTSPSPVELSYDRLKTLSNLPDEACKRVLHSFVKMKLVKKSSPSPSILTTDVFTINEKFRFNLSLLLNLHSVQLREKYGPSASGRHDPPHQLHGDDASQP
jgi:hypothetical protein